MNKNFKILGAVMLGFMSFSCNNNQGNNSSEATTPVWVEDDRFSDFSVSSKLRWFPILFLSF